MPGIELVYFCGFMLACFGAALLARWTTRNLLLYTLWIAVVLSLIKLGIYFINMFPQTYTVSVPC